MRRGLRATAPSLGTEQCTRYVADTRADSWVAWWRIPMRILAIDIGTGTQDVLLWESGVAVENLVQMVMPSPTVLVERRVRAATRHTPPPLLTRVTMGGGPR